MRRFAKKTICIPVILVLLLTSTSFAQETTSVNKIELGVEGGLSIINIRDNKIISEYQKLAFGGSGGVTFQANFTNYVSLKTSVYYEKKGANLSVPYPQYLAIANSGKISYQFSYLTVPVLLKLNTGGKTRVFVNTGPYFSYLLNQKIVSPSYGDYYYSRSYTNNFNRFDIGITLGVGVTLVLYENVFLNIEVRDNLGLKNISENDTNNGDEMKNNAAYIMAGFAFGIGSK